MIRKEIAIKHSVALAVYLFVVWGFYRLLSKLPDDIEDLVIKPIFWLLPVFYLVRKERLGISSLGITFKNFFPSIYISLALGVFLAIVGLMVNYIKYGGINFIHSVGPTSFNKLLLLSFAVAFSEEITFRGYIFNRVWMAIKNEWIANVCVSLVWALVHLPVSIFWWKLDLAGVLGVLFLMFLFGVGSSYVFARTKNVFSSIFLHVFWGLPIILFR
jgi:membrane protease YdiL (CAAX protease family)